MKFQGKQTAVDIGHWNDTEMDYGFW